ncbi:MAG: hypothetical protein L0K89_00100 [Bifidobacterium crudilactis]|nr:hypothetical protein [Bifidobacterium crudilactis]MDN6805260.1 hypothetical protein [Bifidobacterium crudilactis]
MTVAADSPTPQMTAVAHMSRPNANMHTVRHVERRPLVNKPVIPAMLARSELCFAVTPRL